MVSAKPFQFLPVVSPLLAQGSNMVGVLLGQQLGQSFDSASISRPDRPNIIPNMLDPTWDPTLVQQSFIPRQKHSSAVVTAYAQLGVFP
jgi:hypothetical protein